MTETIDVVIPTVGRPSLVSAVRSVLDQVRVEVHVYVVADNGSEAAVRDILGSVVDDVVIVGLTERAGGGGARQIGTEAGRSPWVAYLDDDDTWRPNRLAAQLDHVRQHGADRVLISSRLRFIDPGGTAESSEESPTVAFDADVDLPAWLFAKRKVFGARNSLHTSTILVDRTTATTTGWNVDLARHQDWDFVLRAWNDPDVTVLQHPDVLIDVEAARTTGGSISGSTDWATSLNWAIDAQPILGRKVFVEFLYSQCLRYVLMARSWTGAKQWARTARGAGIPSINALAYASGGLVSSQFVHRIRSVLKRMLRRNAAT